MKIIVAGAGIGGLRAAALLGKAGAEVTVYERAESLERMRYPWHDDVCPEVFAECGLELPEKSFRKKNWSFVPPCGKDIRRLREAEESADYSVWRTPLNAELLKEAERYAKVIFSSEAEGAITENGRVTGVIVNGEKKYADLVIDSLGVDSVLKKNVKGISVCDKDEVFVVYRAFYEKNASAPLPEHANKAYLKHTGERGIAWAIQDGDTVDVLIGRLGEMNEETLSRALGHIKKDNPSVGGRVVTGGGIYRIPVRYPATVTVADGYAAIGDAAFMTIPMLGSGIASSLRAAGMLAERVTGALGRGLSRAEAASAAVLWGYERDFFLSYGAEHCGVDVMKRGVLSFDDGLLSWLLASDVLTDDDVRKLAKGRFLNIGIREAAAKVKAAGISRIPDLLKVNKMLVRGRRAIRIAKKIPVKYDPSAVRKWEKKLVKAVTGK